MTNCPIERTCIPSTNCQLSFIETRLPLCCFTNYILLYLPRYLLPCYIKARIKRTTPVRIIMRNLSIEVEEGETSLLIKISGVGSCAKEEAEAFREASSQTSGLRRSSSFRSLCHSYLHKPPEMTCCFYFFIVSSIYCPLLP